MHLASDSGARRQRALDRDRDSALPVARELDGLAHVGQSAGSILTCASRRHSGTATALPFGERQGEHLQPGVGRDVAEHSISVAGALGPLGVELAYFRRRHLACERLASDLLE